MSKAPADARKGADWMPDESSKCCVRCKKEFTFFTRRHHCYFDGRLLCADCTPDKCVIPAQIGGTSKNEVRVCKECKDWCAQASSGIQLNFEGELRKAYENNAVGTASLSQVEIQKLKTVTLLPEYFISAWTDSRFKQITSVDLSLFVSVHEVGNGFLYRCSSITSVDLQALSKIESLGPCFLFQCSSLKSVDLSMLTSLSSIGSSFLSKCSAVTSVTLPSVSKITSVPDCFLYQCSSLTTVNNMQALSKVNSVGDSFLESCPGLTKEKYLDRVDLTPLSGAASIEDSWLQQAVSGKGIVLRGELLKAYEDSVLGFGSLCKTQIEKLKTVTVLPNEFMNAEEHKRFQKITSVDLSLFVSVREIGRCFLHQCVALASVDLSALRNVTSVGDHFLRECSSLTSLDLQALSNVKSLGKGFLYQSSSLSAINNMSALSKVASVGDHFMRECSSLTSLDLQALSNVKSLGNCFLYQCSSLTAINNMAALSKVTSVPDFFLWQCSSLKSLDLSALSSLASIGKSFLSGCSAVTTINNISALSKVTSVGDHFMRGCSSVKSLDLSGLTSLASIGKAFLSGCSALTTIKNMTALSKVTSLDSHFLWQCSALKSLGLSGLTSLSALGEAFLDECSSLTSVTLPSASKITSVPDFFLSGCSSLTTINNMSALSNVTSVGDHFIQHCLNLTSLDLSSLGTLDSVGKSFLNNSPSLVALDLRPLSNIKNIGAFFLFQCPKLTKKEYLDQIDLSPLLHLSDASIILHQEEDKYSNLKKALQRVRAGGANAFNVPVFLVKLRTDLYLGEETIKFLVKEGVDERRLLHLEESHLASLPLIDKKKLLKEIKIRRESLSSSCSSSSPTIATSAASSRSSYSSSGNTAPSYWKTSLSDPTPVTFVPVPSSSTLFQNIADAFEKTKLVNPPGTVNAGMIESGPDTKVLTTLPGGKLLHDSFQIVNLWHIENPDLWKKYSAERESIQKNIQSNKVLLSKFVPLNPRLRTQQHQNSPVEAQQSGVLEWAEKDLELDSSINETLLFHGLGDERTARTVARDGFDPRIAYLRNVFGSGTYATDRSSKAEEYCEQNSSGSCFLLLGRATLGVMHVQSTWLTSPNTQLSDSIVRRPFCVEGHNVALQGHKSFCPHELTHSTLGMPTPQNGQLYREFVIYDKNQIYPEFMVEFQRVTKNTSPQQRQKAK